MKYLIDKKKIIVIFISLFGFSNVAYASGPFKDVKSNHWAYDFIVSNYDHGWMVGDTKGNFNPSSYIDKFDISRILARIAGYNAKNPSNAEEEYYKKAYDKNKELLAQYEKAFSSWKSNCNWEISFLLEKEILNTNDLNQFVVVSDTNKEIVRNINREEIAMFIVKAIGEDKQANNFKSSFKFADDANIDAKYSPYVYYLKEKGVFTPDAQNKFYPKTQVTRAVLATILHKTILKDLDNVVLDEEVPLGSLTENSVSIESMKGTVDVYFPQINALQVIKEDGDTTIYSLSDDVTIYIDGFLKPPSDLLTGLPFSAVIYDGNTVISITANSKDLVITEPKNDSNLETPSEVLDETVGYVTKIDKNFNAVTIRTSTLNNKDDLVFNYLTLATDDYTKLTKNDNSIKLSDIQVGDKVYFTHGETLKTLSIKPETTDKKALLTAKKMDYTTNKPVLYFVLGDEEFEYEVTNNSLLTRKGVGKTSYNNLRNGDYAEIKIIDDKLVDLYAYGEISYVEGVVDSIEISNESPVMGIKNSQDEVTYYKIVPSAIDVYSIRVGSKIRAKLDSKEIESVTFLGGPSKLILTGTIKSYNKNTKVLSVYDSNYNFYVKDVKIDNNTNIINGRSGAPLDSSYLKENTQVYIVINGESQEVATSVAIIN